MQKQNNTPFVVYVTTLILSLSVALILFGLWTMVPHIGSWLDSLSAYIEAADWAGLGELLGTLVVAKWDAEVAKLLFWIHLLS